MSKRRITPQWLAEHRATRPYAEEPGALPLTRPWYSQAKSDLQADGIPRLKLLSDRGFNSHDHNDGQHVSPYDNGVAQVGIDGLRVKLLQGVDEEQFKRFLSRAVKATTGVSLDAPEEDTDWEESMRGGLQMGLETQVLVFEVEGASRALTHQLVRSTRARFQQQSQRATWYGDRPEVRVPESIMRNPRAAAAFEEAIMASWKAYSVACQEGVSYQDARYGLLEGTTNYIQCQYSIREFINVFAYRGCTMFLWEMVAVMHEMRRVLLEAHPFLEPYIKISCEKGALCGSCGGSGKFSYSNPTLNGSTWVEGIPEGSDCPVCDGLGGDRKCTFNGWENVEGVCSLPWAKQSNRVFLPTPKFRINDTEKETN